MALGQMLSQSISLTENYSAPVTRSSASLSKNVSRLLSAMVVSPRFRHLLFSDPVAALAAGYNGERFQLTPVEYAAITSLRVNTVRDFAAQLLHLLSQVATEPAFCHAEARPEHQVHNSWASNTEFKRS